MRRKSIRSSCARVMAFVIAAVLSIPAIAQNGVSVRLKLTDEKSGEAVGFATASLTEENAEKPYKYSLSSSEGNVVFDDVKSGTFTLKVELMGYKSVEQTVKVEGKDLSLGEIKMAQDAKVLDAANVSAAGNPIIIKKDTVEYNASSFKTTDNDMLEELLKKLPGVEVGTDGSVTVNGESVNKITIDGKTFFLDDPTLATKNIPAKIVEKVKVVDKMSDQAIFTGIDDGERETVIDLTVYKGMMNGWFGNVMGGGGHDLPDAGYYTDDNKWTDDGWRYQGSAMVGRFTESSQLSLIANGNNTNNRGFNDMAGSMMSSMRGGRGMGQGTGGFGGNNGITTSWMAGLNGAFTLLDGDMDLSGNYLYNGSNNSVEESSSKITYLDDGSSLIYDNDGYNITKSQGHRFGVRLDHSFTEKTSLLFEPQVNFGKGSFTEYSKFTTWTNPGDGNTSLTNDGFSENTGWNNNWTTSGMLLFRQRFTKPGRTISLSLNYNFSGNKLNGFNQSYTDNDLDETGDEEIVNQRYTQTTNSSSFSARLSYTEPLATNFFLEADYSYSWNRSKSYKDTYDSSSDLTDGDHLIYNAAGETYSDAYSNSIINKYQNHSAGVTVMYQKDKLRAQVGASLQPTITDNVTNGETYSSTVLNWAPQVMFSYDINENNNLRIMYMGRSSQPSTSQLMPVADNSDPLNVSFGNPYLEPYFTHSLRGNYGYTNKDTFLSLRANLTGSLVQNNITNAMWYDSNGAQYSLPLNGPTSGNASVMLMINSPIKRSNFSIFSMTNIRYSNSMSYVGKTENGMGDKLIENYYNFDTGVLDYDAFHRDFFDHNDAYSAKLNFHDYFTDSKTNSLTFSERLRFTYRDDLVEVIVGGQTRMNKSWYSISSYNQKATWNNSVEASMNWTIPGGVGLVAQANYNWYDGYTTQQDPEIVMNAEISKLLFHDAVTLAVKAYDIFNQSKNLNVTDQSNYHQETRNNTLGRYIVVSLTFRFGNFGGNRRGPGNGGPGGRPGGGPGGAPGGGAPGGGAPPGGGGGPR